MILLGILAVLNIAVVWNVPTYPVTFKSSSLFNNTFVTVPKAPITIGIIFTFMLHSFIFFTPLKSRSTYPSFNILSFLFFFVDYY